MLEEQKITRKLRAIPGALKNRQQILMSIFSAPVERLF